MFYLIYKLKSVLYLIYRPNSIVYLIYRPKSVVYLIYKLKSVVYLIYRPKSVVYLIYRLKSIVYLIYRPKSVVYLIYRPKSVVYLIYKLKGVVYLIYRPKSVVYFIYRPKGVVYLIYRSKSVVYLIYRLKSVVYLIYRLKSLINSPQNTVSLLLFPLPDMEVLDTRQLELEDRLQKYNIAFLSNIIETLGLTPPPIVSQLGNLRVLRNYMDSSTDTDVRKNCLDAIEILCVTAFEGDEDATVPAKPDDMDVLTLLKSLEETLSKTALKNEFRISGTIGPTNTKGDKSYLSYISLIHQLETGHRLPYTDDEIIGGVIRAMSPGLRIRTVIGTLANIKLYHGYDLCYVVTLTRRQHQSYSMSCLVVSSMILKRLMNF